MIYFANYEFLRWTVKKLKLDFQVYYYRHRIKQRYWPPWWKFKCHTNSFSSNWPSRGIFISKASNLD